MPISEDLIVECRTLVRVRDGQALIRRNIVAGEEPVDGYKRYCLQIAVPVAQQGNQVTMSQRMVVFDAEDDVSAFEEVDRRIEDEKRIAREEGHRQVMGAILAQPPPASFKLGGTARRNHDGHGAA